MQIRRKIERVETVEVPTPSWWKSGPFYAAITDDGTLFRFCHVTIYKVGPSSNSYAKYVDEIMNFEPISRKEFEQAYDDLISDFNNQLKR